MTSKIDNEGETLKSLVELIRTWKPGNRNITIKDAFIQLQNLDQNKNKELWTELQDAIYHNPNLAHPDFMNSFDNEFCSFLTREGYWWYNKGLWGSLG